MPTFRDWLDRVLAFGESVQDPPLLAPADRPAAEERLHAEFASHMLDVAGPLIDFSPNVAVRAAEALAHTCRLLTGADGPLPALEPIPSPAAHLSADLTLRFLPTAYRRAKAHAPEGPLAAALDRLLRAWPLSGVLANLDGAPTVAPDFGHPGLQLLYAERFVGSRRAGWVPQQGPAREWAERVFAEHGVPLPELPKENVRD
jgi:hypothetical protein